MKDKGSRRYRVFTLDFDARADILSMQIDEAWDDAAKVQWQAHKESIIQRLGIQYGTSQIAQKVQNFTDLGSKPFSIIAYHNAFFEQARGAFVVGSYYPALTAACSLGERILNHLIIDLREVFRTSPEYKSVYRKGSFDDWTLAIDTLSSWGVLLPEVAENFRKLEKLRHRSIHFNQATYANVRDDALTAMLLLREIVGNQFSAFGPQPWFIVGTPGASFIKREYETNPFIRAYFLPRCPFVGPRHSIGFDPPNMQPQFFDLDDYGDVVLTDEEFASSYEEARKLGTAVSSDPK